VPVGEWVGSGVFGVSTGGGGGGSGTVTSVSVVSANGLAGTVANATTTPAITLSTSINSPVLAGNGTAISAATSTGTGSTVVLSASPALTGTPTAPTAAAGTNTTQLATTAFVTTAAGAKMNNLVRTAVKTTTYSAAADDLVPCDSTSGSFTVTLPTAPADQTLIEVKHIIQGTTSGTGNTITVAAGGSDVINRAAGPTSVTLPLIGESRAFLYQSSTAIWTIVWAELPQQSGAAPNRVTAQSANYNAIAGDIVLATAGGGGFTVTLPASTISSQIVVKKVDGGAGTITITPTSGTIDGSASATITTRYVSLTLVADGTNWNLI
jgi:hypothetical protein